jgi:hypothetical protein
MENRVSQPELNESIGNLGAAPGALLLILLVVLPVTVTYNNS